MIIHVIIEVEALIEQSVSQVLSTRPKILHRRVELVNALVKALENNAKWIGLYSVTSQLEVPETADLDGELGEALHEIKEVGFCLCYGEYLLTDIVGSEEK
jgi:hypothetical protein